MKRERNGITFEFFTSATSAWNLHISKRILARQLLQMQFWNFWNRAHFVYLLGFWTVYHGCWWSVKCVLLFRIFQESVMLTPDQFVVFSWGGLRYPANVFAREAIGLKNCLFFRFPLKQNFCLFSDEIKRSWTVKCHLRLFKVNLLKK